MTWYVSSGTLNPTHFLTHSVNQPETVTVCVAWMLLDTASNLTDRGFINDC